MFSAGCNFIGVNIHIYSILCTLLVVNWLLFALPAYVISITTKLQPLTGVSLYVSIYCIIIITTCSKYQGCVISLTISVLQLHLSRMHPIVSLAGKNTSNCTLCYPGKPGCNVLIYISWRKRTVSEPAKSIQKFPKIPYKENFLGKKCILFCTSYRKHPVTPG
jgi:hypothetical protein